MKIFFLKEFKPTKNITRRTVITSALKLQERFLKYIRLIKIPSPRVEFMVAAPCRVAKVRVIDSVVFFLANINPAITSLALEANGVITKLI